MLLVLFLSIGIVSANEINDVNVTSISDESQIEVEFVAFDENNFEDSNVLQVSSQDSVQTSDVNVTSANDESQINNVEGNNFEDSSVLQVSFQDSLQYTENIIVVNNWEELQYYCTQTDKDYTLKLKENTNFYPIDPSSSSCQIKIKNNVKIIGSEGSWIGDSSKEPRVLMHIAITVPDDSKVKLTLENITFKWIKVAGGFYLPDGRFIYIGGKKNSIINNCRFYDMDIEQGHSCIVHLGKGTATLDNCSFINCTTNYGCLSVYGSSPHMTVKDCYFENNYASTEPGCINNCGKLTVYNTTFVKNRSFWWAGAIHTHSGANSTIYDSKFIDNVAGWNGGALYTYSYLQVYNSIFIGNNCTTNNGGGAIGACQYGSNPHIYIENCFFENNANNCWYTDSLSDGTGRGGAISIMDVGSLEVRDSTFIANVAAQGTAICAINAGSYGSPDVYVINNSFINHTRVRDVLVITTKDKIVDVHDNYYLGNSIVFSNLTLTKLSEGKEQASFKITATLSHPSYYDKDIMNRTLYDVYINNKYVKTVNTTTFSIDFGDLDICDVYVIPTISNRKSNEVTATSTREYVFVSKNNGDDNNNGISRDTPVNTIKRALELAKNCQNIILLDGDYSEENIQINYDVTIKGESDATLMGTTSFISNSNLTLKNLKINDLNTDIFIKQNNNNLIISNCILTNNAGSLVQNNGFTTIANSILLNNSNILQGNNNYVLDYNWWGNSIPDLNINNYITLNLTSDVSALENNQKANVKAVFYSNNGTKYTKLPEINLDITAVNGIVNQNIVGIDSNIIYTLTGFSDSALTVSYNDFKTTKTFEFLKSTPTISIVTEDIMYGDNLTVTIALPSDAEGNLTVNVGNISQSKVVESQNTVFTFQNLKANTYAISATYTGDKKYLFKTTTASVNVNKYQSATNLNISTIKVGEDVILTITTTDSSTGNVTLSINSNIQTLALTDSKASYTIKNIKRGDYLFTAVYNGDDKYLTSQDSKFIEVDNLNPTMTIKADDITYGEKAVIKVTLNNDATGEVIVTIDGISNSSKVIKGNAEVTFTNLEAGSNKDVSVFYSGDDTYFNLTKSSTFNIAKADLIFTIESKDIKIGQFGEIIIKVPAKTSGTFTINEDTMNIPLSGEISYIIPDLEIGNYTYTATYNGNNYNTVSKTTSFKVSEYPTPQWANEGGNTQNTHKSSYETDTNGEIAFTIPFNQTLSGELAIDSIGNLYLTTQEGIYCFNQTNRLWYFTSVAAAGNLSGIAIGRDVVIAPKSGDTLYFINQTTGERYGGSNIYQGSSLFAPVIDSNATLYIVSEYQFASEDYKLTIIPYKLWENGGDPTLITIGNTQPLCSPTLNENIIVIISDNYLRLIDAKSLQTITIKSGNYLPIRPVIGEGNIVYAVLSDSIVAYNANGMQVWKTKVTGKVGTGLVVDPEQGVYHINSRKVLYRYDIVDGKEYKVSSLKVTSGLLVGSDGTLYFGSNNIFYALDSEGNVLWKSDLKSKIIGNPVMDKSGLIYAVTENGIVALAYAPLKEPNLKIQVDDIVEGQTATVTVTWNSQATGTVTCNVNGEEITANADEGKITKSISGLDIGYYDVEASYSGDMRFSATTATKTFVVRSADDLANNIQFDGNQTFSFSLNNAKGNLTVKIADKTYSKVLVNGKASITIDSLNPGEYDALVIYSGDNIYSSANRTFSLSVPKLNMTLNEQINIENIVATISVTLPSDATGNLTLSVGTKKYTQKINKGRASIIVDDIPAGNYTATLTYSGDDKYESASKTIDLKLTKIPVELNEDNLVIISPSTSPSISVNLDSRSTGKLIVVVGYNEYSSNLVDGCAEVIIDDLDSGNYTAEITYSGDNRFEKASQTVNLEVPKKVIEFNETTLSIKTDDNTAVFSVNLPDDVTGNITISVNDEKILKTLNRGKCIIEFENLTAGNHEAVINYTGDNNYEPAIKSVRFSISMINITLDDTNLFIENLTVTVKLYDDAKGNLTVIVNDKEFSEVLVNGCASLEVTGLTPGSYNATVVYSGDDKYAVATKDITLTVPKIISNLDNLIISQNNNVIDVSIDFGNDAGGMLTVNVGDRNYSASVVNGVSSISISDLVPGNYSALIIYSGDNNYTNASKVVDLEVPKIKIDVDNNTLVIDSSINPIFITLTLPDDATGTLTVNLDSKNYTREVTAGKAIVNIADLKPGEYTAHVTYSGDDKYEAIVFEDVVLNIDKLPSSISVSVADINVGETAIVNITTSVIAGKVTVTLNNKQYNITVDNYIAQLPVTGLGAGNYTVTARFLGDEAYSPCVNTTVFMVSKVKLDEDVLSVNGTVFTLNLPSDATGSLIVSIDKNYTQDVVNAKAVVNVSDLKPGKYTAHITYSGDDKYEGIVFEDAVLNIDKLPSSISVAVADINVGETAIINITASVASGKVTVTVNNKDYNVTVSNYIGQLSVPDLGEGNYTVVARFLGDDVYADSINTTSFSVLRVEIPVDNETITIPDSADTTSYSINLPEDATGTFTVSVDGVPYTANLVNGKATVTIPELTVGSHNITVIYSGDSKYSPIVKSVIVNKTTPPHVPVIKLTGSNLNMLYTSGKYYKVRLTSDGKALANTKVKITINGKTYTRTTNSNGYASLKVTLAPKTYTVKATYGTLKITNKVVVKSVIKAKNVNAKKSAKKVKIKVTLKKVNGKYLKNKKVTLKFNKKTIKAKTNKKGVVTFTIKKNVYKKLKTNKKYTYQVIYGKDKVKKSIKFKK